ncbi:hypothetical protein SAMN06313486_10236 [Epsilonproteobacteria bacterium SCGC AD-308-P11]|nr:hypothetical protein SAMN06313486_10236 [Epsilonproteobacteria bacterium SCGC AD-308-P11]
MSKVIGTITGLEGTFQVKDAQGNLHEVSNGDKIHEGETVIGDKENALTDGITVSMNDGSEIFINGTDSQLFDASLSQEAFAAEETVTQADSLVALLQENGDVETNAGDDIETAAGEGTALSTEGVPANFAAANGGIVDINADLYDRAFSDAIPTADAPPLEEVVVPTPAEATLTLNDVNVDEGTEAATIGGSLDQAPTDGPVVFTLSNGATITFGIDYVAGTVVQSTPFSIQGDDVYVDGENYNVSATGYTGGTEFANIVTADTGAVTISDTITPVTVDLTASAVNEDAEDTSYVFTATLSAASQGVTTVVTDQGTIEIADGETVGTLTVASGNAGDVYNDATELTATITSATGGNFEKINVGTAEATATVADTITPVTATLTTTATEISETGGAVTYTVTLSGAPGLIDPDNNLVFKLTNGEEVTILAGAKSGSVTTTYTDADITNQANITNSFDAVTPVKSGGAEYESLLTAGSTTVDINYSPSGKDGEVSQSDGDIDGNIATAYLNLNYGNDGVGTFSVNYDGGLGTATSASSGGITTLTAATWVLTINESTGESRFDQIAAYTHVENTDTAEGKVIVTITDADGTSHESELKLTIEDNTPVINEISNAVVDNEAGLSVSGSIDAEFVDVPLTYSLSGSVAPTGLTYTYNAVGTLLTAIDGTGDPAFTVQVNADGTYDFNLLKASPESVAVSPDFDTLSIPNHTTAFPVVLYSSYDSNGVGIGSPLGTVTFRVNNAGTEVLSVSNDGLGINNNLMNNGEKLFMDFDSPVSNTTFSIGNFSVNGTPDKLHWTVYDAAGQAIDTGIIVGSYNAYDANGNIVTLPVGNESQNYSINLAINGLSVDSFSSMSLEADAGAYKFEGFSVEKALTVDDQTYDFTLTATDADHDATSSSFAVTVDGSGSILEGGAGDDTINAGTGIDTIVFDADDSHIDGGDGYDTLLITDALTIDFAAVADKATSIEVVDLQQGQVDTIAISLSDVLQMTDGDTTGTLRLNVDDTDNVTLESTDDNANPVTWTTGADTTDGYHTYTGSSIDGTVTLEINTLIDVPQS